MLLSGGQPSSENPFDGMESFSYKQASERGWHWLSRHRTLSTDCLQFPSACGLVIALCACYKRMTKAGGRTDGQTNKMKGENKVTR